MTDTVLESNSQIAPRSPKRAGWIITGVAVLVVLGGATWLLSRPSSTGISIPPADLYTVGSLSQSANITTTGTVATNSQVNVAFQNVNGTITALNAHVGQKVKAGQVLAVLQNATLQAQVQQAQAGVAQAEGALAQANGSVAQAEQAVKQAEAQYRVVTQGATPQNIAVAESGVNSAKTALANAESQYQAQLASYNDRTAQLQQLTQAQNAVTQAKTGYDTALQSLKTAQQNQQSAITAAQNALSTAQNNLQVDQQNLTTDQQQYGTITLAQVKQEYAAYQTALNNYNSWQNGAYAGINPYAGTMQADQAKYQTDSQGYYTLQGDQQKVKADEAAISAAQNQLTTAQNSVVQVQTQVDQAKANYNAALKAEQVAQQAYNDRTAQHQALVAAESAVSQEQKAVKQAEATLKQVQQPATPALVNQAKTAIQSAQAGVNTANAGVKTATAGVKSAQAQLHTALVNEGYTVLRAPVDGTIVTKISSVGEFVGAGQPIVTMDTPQMQVDLAVSDTQLPFVKIGSPITMTVGAIPGKVFSGKVYEIDPTPITGNGNEYQVKASITNAANLLQPGMSGNVTLLTSSSGTELAVPAMALQQVNGVYGVYVLGNNQTTASSSSAYTSNLPNDSYFQPVQVGFQGTKYVEITSGLKTGQKVLLGVGRFISTSSGSTH